MRAISVVIWCSLTMLIHASSSPSSISHMKTNCGDNTTHKLLVVTPDLLMGLTNQVMTAVSGILLGIRTGRNTCLGGFYLRTGSKTYHLLYICIYLVNLLLVTNCLLHQMLTT